MAHPFCAGRANRCRITISITAKYAETGKFISIILYRLKYRDRDSLIVKAISFNYIVCSNSVDASVDKKRHSKRSSIG